MLIRTCLLFVVLLTGSSCAKRAAQLEAPPDAIKDSVQAPPVRLTSGVDVVQEEENLATSAIREAPVGDAVREGLDTLAIHKIVIRSLKRGNANSSASVGEYAKRCAAWTLTTKDIAYILTNSRFISGTDWDMSFNVLPCEYEGEVLINDSVVYRYAINAASHAVLYSGRHTYYMGYYGLKEFFMETPGPLAGDKVPLANVTVSGIALGVVSEDLVTRLGHPDSIHRSIDRYAADSVYTYCYNRTAFSFVRNRLTGFVVGDAAYVFGKAGLRVGGDAAGLQKLFPNSYTERFVTETGEILVKVFVDRKTYVVFVLKEGIISGYRLWVDW